jgi:competence protein ComGF
MRLKSAIEAANTQAKLAMLEAHYEAAKARDMGNPTAHESVLFSLRRMINQLKEEIIRYECDVKSGRIKEEIHTP